MSRVHHAGDGVVRSKCQVNAVLRAVSPLLRPFGLGRSSRGIHCYRHALAARGGREGWELPCDIISPVLE